MRYRLLATAAVASFALITPATAETSDGSIPLCPGLTIVTAITQVQGDYESIKIIEAMDETSVRLKYASESPVNDVPGQTRTRRLNVNRVMRPADLKASSNYLQQFHSGAPASVPGTTAIGVSAAVLKDLKTKGEAELNIFDLPTGPLSADPDQHPSIFDYQLKAKLKREGDAPVMIELIVNGEKRKLPAIHATGAFYREKAEFYFLDDEANPLTLRFRLGIGAKKSAEGGSASDRDTLRVVKIKYDCSAQEAAAENALERALEKNGRVDIHSIYFSFNSDQIRPQSEPTLREIADILKRHPDWKLAIEGHTDAIGSDDSNQELSSRRSAAVKGALAGRYEIDGGRLTTSGRGESAPKDTNETPEGRAHNRRVELVRQQ
jgi:outer membrane protein OmpA-like peptidoglycan-associated protein